MHKEVEIKAHVAEDKVKNLKASLIQEFGEPSSEKKSDTYYKNKDGEDVRIRESLGIFILTKKDQAMDGGVEVNNEYEKILTANEKLETEKSLAPFMKKTKVGYIWSPPIDGFKANIELVKVCGFYLTASSSTVNEKDLGYFLETEFLIEDDECNKILLNEKIQKAKQRLESFYKEYGLYENIESRKYMQMLKE